MSRTHYSTLLYSTHLTHWIKPRKSSGIFSRSIIWESWCQIVRRSNSSRYSCQMAPLGTTALAESNVDKDAPTTTTLYPAWDRYLGLTFQVVSDCFQSPTWAKVALEPTIKSKEIQTRDLINAKGSRTYPHC
jgi:hypothetical protein